MLTTLARHQRDDDVRLALFASASRTLSVSGDPAPAGDDLASGDAPQTAPD